jgi:hypothetical protein
MALLGEDCCFFSNKSGIVRDGIKKKQLRDRAQQLTHSQPTFLFVPRTHPTGGPSHPCLSGSNIPTMPH